MSLSQIWPNSHVRETMTIKLKIHKIEKRDDGKNILEFLQNFNTTNVYKKIFDKSG